MELIHNIIYSVDNLKEELIKIKVKRKLDDLGRLI